MLPADNQRHFTAMLPEINRPEIRPVSRGKLVSNWWVLCGAYQTLQNIYPISVGDFGTGNHPKSLGAQNVDSHLTERLGR